jgi:hypothetical protein
LVKSLFIPDTVKLDGYFYIGAVRQPHMHLSLKTADAADAEAILRERYVGAGGENVWLLERHFAASPVVFQPKWDKRGVR